MSIAFFCRAKPQGCDAISIFQQAKHVFIGHPLPRPGVIYDPGNLGEWIVDPTCPDEEWLAIPSRNRNHAMNRNFVRRVEEARQDGAIVVIPRPADGVVHLARITGPFGITDAPKWGPSYLDLRERQGCDLKEQNHHIADVAQGWPVDGYRQVPLARIPGWLRRSTLGRSTYGELRPHPLDSGVTAYNVLDDVLDQFDHGKPAPRRGWTLCIREIKMRLVDDLTPTSFEHLVVSLLQLEHLAQSWQHTGGPGDGGIDGFGSDQQRNTVGLLQAKFFAKQAPNFVTSRLRSLPQAHQGPESATPRIRRYIAVLLPEHPKRPKDGSCFLDLEWVAEAVQRHWKRLPQALAMRVGESS